MDEASAKFKSAQADLTQDLYERVVKETTTETGSIYFERHGATTEMGLRLNPPNTRFIEYKNGVARIFDPGANHITEIRAGANQGQYESYLTLGFGGKGSDLAKSWDITDQGTEQINDGTANVTVEKLDLVSKDPAVRNNFLHITIWIDPTRSLSPAPAVLPARRRLPPCQLHPHPLQPEDRHRPLRHQARQEPQHRPPLSQSNQRTVFRLEATRSCHSERSEEPPYFVFCLNSRANRGRASYRLPGLRSGVEGRTSPQRPAYFTPSNCAWNAIIRFNVSYGISVIGSIRPFTESIGVWSTPASSASFTDAFTSALVASDFAQAATAAGSSPAFSTAAFNTSSVLSGVSPS